MKGSFTAKPQTLGAAVAWAAKWIDSRPAVPAHAGLLLTAGDGRLVVGAYNENAGARALLDVEGDAVGRVVVSGRLLAELVATFPDKVITVEPDDRQIVLTAGRFTATLPTLPEDEYPQLPEAAPTGGTVSGDAFATAVARIGEVAKRTDDAGLLGGVHLHFSGNGLEVMASDRIRAARLALPWESAAGRTDETALIEVGTLMDVAKSFAGPDDIRIGLGGVASFTSPTRTVSTRRLAESEYPAADFRRFLATSFPDEAVVTVGDLAMPLKRAALVSGKPDKGGEHVRLSFESDTLTVGGMNAQSKRESGEMIDCQYDGEPVEMTVRLKYLTDALAGATPEARLAFSGEKLRGRVGASGVLVTSPSDPSYRHIFMSLRRM